MSLIDLSAARARWDQLSARERIWIQVAAAVLSLTLLWQVALAPALKIWRESTARHAQLDRQHSELLALQQQARSLQARPAPSRQEAQQSLAQLTRDLLPGAQLSSVADQPRVVVKNLSGAQLAQWLTAVRQSAQASVTDLRLQRSPSSPPTPAQWDGQITLQLPSRGAP
jgi:general secretion pathway protein M